MQGHKAAIHDQQNFSYLSSLLLNFRLILEITIFFLSIFLYSLLHSDQGIMTTRRSRFMSSLLIFLEQRYSLLCPFIRGLPIISTLSNKWTWCFLSFISCEHLHTVHIVRVSNIFTNAIDCSIWLQGLTTIVRLFIFFFLILG